MAEVAAASGTASSAVAEEMVVDSTIVQGQGQGQGQGQREGQRGGQGGEIIQEISGQEEMMMMMNVDHEQQVEDKDEEEGENAGSGGHAYFTASELLRLAHPADNNSINQNNSIHINRNDSSGGSDGAVIIDESLRQHILQQVHHYFSSSQRRHDIRKADLRRAARVPLVHLTYHRSSVQCDISAGIDVRRYCLSSSLSFYKFMLEVYYICVTQPPQIHALSHIPYHFLH